MANLALDSPATPATSAPASRRLLAATWPIVAAIVTAVLVVTRWIEMGPYPTGLDGGQWLALGRGLLGGPGRSTDGMYAPLVPLLAALASAAVGPVLGLKLVALFSYAAVLVALAILARPELGWPATIVALIVVGSASAIVEPIAYGGYPQTLAFAAMLVGCGALSASLSGHARSAVWAALAFAAAAASHHIYGALAVACGATIWALWALDPAAPGRRRAGLRRAVATLAPGALIAVALLFVFHAKGYVAPVDAARMGWIDAFVYATREAPAVWAVVLAGGIASLLANRRRLGPLEIACAALIVVPGALFLAFPESRLVPPILGGGLLALLRGLCRWSRSPAQVSVAPSMLISALLLAALVPAGDLAARQYFAYYRTLDQSLVDAAAVVQRHPSDGIVVVRDDVHGWPIGWWLEGLTTARIAAGSDPRWLGFPEERTAAAQAADFFDRRLAPDALRSLAEQTGVHLLVVREREWIGWRRWLAAPHPPVTVVFDDGETLVLRIDSVEQ